MMVQRRAWWLPLGLWWRVLPAAVALVLTGCSASDSGADATSASPSVGPASSKYPNAIVVLGHSGTTGAESNPSSPGNDDTRNSWATGDNPAVNSVYARLLALNPAVRGHNTNLGVDGTNVDDLGDQVDSALALKPLPDLFMIQEVDNDMQCDGTDPDNYLRFAKSMSDQLAKITAKAPRATILLVSSPPGTVENYGTIASRLPAAKAANTGTGPCDLFSPSGRAVPDAGATRTRSPVPIKLGSPTCASSSRPAATTEVRSIAWSSAQRTSRAMAFTSRLRVIASRPLSSGKSSDSTRSARRRAGRLHRRRRDRCSTSRLARGSARSLRTTGRVHQRRRDPADAVRKDPAPPVARSCPDVSARRNHLRDLRLRRARDDR